MGAGPTTLGLRAACATFCATLCIGLLAADASAKADRTGAYDLSRAHLLTRVLERVGKDYADPSRVRPKEMAVRALLAAQQLVPSLQVAAKRDEAGVPTAVEVNIGGSSVQFDLLAVGDLDALATRLRSILGFVQRRLPPAQDLAALEHRAINGVLRTLDNHTRLISARAHRERQANLHGRLRTLGLDLHTTERGLTVRTVSDDSPAALAGLLADDVVLTVGEVPVAGMRTPDVIQLLVAPRQVAVAVRRGDAAIPIICPLVAGTDRQSEVEHQHLKDGLGYLRIRSFRPRTATDLRAALEALDEAASVEGKPMRGLVFDLRGNPGGYLVEALRVADMFIDSGALVAEVRGGSEPAEVRREATAEGTRTDLALAVLLDGASASAAELVGGALQHSGRAVILGQRSFGKGSMQRVYTIDGAALHLTVGEYRVGGDTRVNGVGIQPDVEVHLVDVTVDGVVDLGTAREADVVASAGEPALKSYALAPGLDSDGYPLEDVVADLAADILAEVKRPTRKALLASAAEVTTRKGEADADVIAARLAELAVDWAPGQVSTKPRVDVALDVLAGGGDVRDRARAGDLISLRARVTNRSRRPLHRVHGVVSSGVPALDGLELAFGRVGPGETREWTLPATLPRRLASQGDVLRLRLFSDRRELASTATAEIAIDALPEPLFAWTAQVLDPQGNGDGLVQPGEQLTFRLQVTNIGPGVAEDTHVTIGNDWARGLRIDRGVYNIGEIPPDYTGAATFQMRVDDTLDVRYLPISISVRDDVRRTSAHGETTLYVFPVEYPRAEPASGLVQTVAEPVPVRAGAHHLSPPVAMALPGSVLHVQRSARDWLRVAWSVSTDDLQAWRVGWIPAERATPVKDMEPTPETIAPVLQHHPPALTLDAATRARLVTTQPRLEIAGTVRFAPRAGSGQRDLHIYHGDEKVLFLSAHRTGRERDTMEWTTTLKLAPGPNLVRVEARDGEHAVTRRRLTIYRRIE